VNRHKEGRERDHSALGVQKNLTRRGRKKTPGGHGKTTTRELPSVGDLSVVEEGGGKKTTRKGEKRRVRLEDYTSKERCGKRP